MGEAVPWQSGSSATVRLTEHARAALQSVHAAAGCEARSGVQVHRGSAGACLLHLCRPFVRSPFLSIRRRSDFVDSCTPRRPNGPDQIGSAPIPSDGHAAAHCATAERTLYMQRYLLLSSSERAVVPSWSVRDEASQSVRAAHALAHSQAHARTHRDAHARTRTHACLQALVGARWWQLQRARYSATSAALQAVRMLERRVVGCTGDTYGVLHQ
jgi:hypothetical protein